MIVERVKGRTILIRYREGRERKEMRIGDVHPYCFVRDGDAEYIPAYAKEKGYKGLYGENLTKITMGDPSDIGALKRDFMTWEANIPFVNRVLVDKDIMIPNYEHRVWYLDMEWKEISNEITIITVLDTFTNNLYTWAVPPTPDTVIEPTGKTPAPRYFKNEKEMLLDFCKLLSRQDPDVISGWAVVWADIQTLAQRLKANGLSPNLLSPMNRHRYDYGDWDQPVPGRLCIDLMDAFCKLYEMKNGKLPNKKLDTVAYEALGDRKVELPDGHDTYYTDFNKYLRYNIQDVELLPRLNRVNNAIEHFLAVQHLVGCDFRTTPFITKLFTILALRDKDFQLRIPSKPQFTKEDYQGADIQEPEPGVYENIAILDVKAMYHSNVHKYGISWETISEDGQDIGNGLCFDTSKKGLLCRQMDYMTDLRNEYKAKMKAAASDQEKRMYDSLQYATKSLVASMYGCAGDSKYGFYHPAVAAAITYSSRQTLGELRQFCEDRGYPVVYGHTDSVFVQIPSPEEGMALIPDIDEALFPIETEFEKWASHIILHAKNRYACNVRWTDGEHHSSQIYIKGIELKQSRMPEVMKRAMKIVIGGILQGKSQADIQPEMIAIVSLICSEEYEPKNDLFMRGKLDKDLSQYKVLSEARAAAAWANKWLGKGYGEGSSFWVALDDAGSYIAFDDWEEPPTIGWKEMCKRFVLDKIEPYYRLAGWDYQELINEYEGKSSVDWL